MSTIDHKRLDQIVLSARKASDEREKGYREKALKIYPWICGRCTREFTHTNLRELTVHHREVYYISYKVSDFIRVLFDDFIQRVNALS